MDVTVQIPDDIASRLARAGDLPRCCMLAAQVSLQEQSEALKRLGNR